MAFPRSNSKDDIKKQLGKNPKTRREVLRRLNRQDSAGVKSAIKKNDKDSVPAKR
jgi:hypothetical protein